MPAKPRKEPDDGLNLLLAALGIALVVFLLGLGETILEIAQATFVGLFLLITVLTRYARD